MIIKKKKKTPSTCEVCAMRLVYDVKIGLCNTKETNKENLQPPYFKLFLTPGGLNNFSFLKLTNVITAHSWCDGHSTSISTWRVWGARIEI